MQVCMQQRKEMPNQQPGLFMQVNPLLSLTLIPHTITFRGNFFQPTTPCVEISHQGSNNGLHHESLHVTFYHSQHD